MLSSTTQPNEKFRDIRLIPLLMGCDGDGHTKYLCKYSLLILPWIRIIVFYIPQSAKMQNGNGFLLFHMKLTLIGLLRKIGVKTDHEMIMSWLDGLKLSDLITQHSIRFYRCFS